MTSILVWAALAAAGIAAGTIGGIAGFGSAVLLLPVCVFAFGASKAVPILTIASLMGNVSRAAFSWEETDWTVVRVYTAGAIPATMAGAYIFATSDTILLQRALGLLILLMIPARRWLEHRGLRMRLWQFLPLGMAMGLLSGVAGMTGPINAPYFLAYGLVKGAYLATEALGSATIHLVKSTVYGRFALLDMPAFFAGIALGLALVTGSWLGKRIVNRIDAAAFTRIVEMLLLLAGSAMLAGV